MSADTTMILLQYITSWSFKSTPKDDLEKELIIRATGEGKSENYAYSEVGNLVVDRLLLRDLFCNVTRTRCKKRFSLT